MYTPPLPHNYTTITTQTTTTQCKLPECKCSICASGWMKKHHQRKLHRVNHHVCKWTICASGCRIKHHQRKLQLVTTTICASCADCCIVLCRSYPVDTGGACSCMLLLHPVPTSADAGPDLCTLCPDLCTLHPDLCTLRLWCFPSFNWCNHSTSCITWKWRIYRYIRLCLHT